MFLFDTEIYFPLDNDLYLFEDEICFPLKNIVCLAALWWSYFQVVHNDVLMFWSPLQRFPTGLEWDSASREFCSTLQQRFPLGHHSIFLYFSIQVFIFYSLYNSYLPLDCAKTHLPVKFVQQFQKIPICLLIVFFISCINIRFFISISVCQNDKKSVT